MNADFAPLTRDRILVAGVTLADRSGLDNLSMRKLGQELGVDAMAIYRHVQGKDDLLDGVAEVVIGEIERPPPGSEWIAGLRGIVMAARSAMLCHPWAPRVLEERRTAGPQALAHIDAVLATLLAGGFTMETAHHALHVLSSRIFGFHQDLFDDSGRAPDPEAQAMVVGRCRSAIRPWRNLPPQPATKAAWARATTTRSSRSGST